VKGRHLDPSCSGRNVALLDRLDLDVDPTSLHRNSHRLTQPACRPCLSRQLRNLLGERIRAHPAAWQRHRCLRHTTAVGVSLCAEFFGRDGRRSRAGLALLGSLAGLGGHDLLHADLLAPARPVGRRGERLLSCVRGGRQ
jgi:hypothetical protein